MHRHAGEKVIQETMPQRTNALKEHLVLKAQVRKALLGPLLSPLMWIPLIYLPTSTLLALLFAVECLLDKPPSIIISGMCSTQSTSDGFYQVKSETNTGRYYYENDNGRFIYFDPMCDGSTLYNEWIFDDNEPSTTAVNDLDGEIENQCGPPLFILTSLSICR